MMHCGVKGKPAPIISTDGCNKVLAWAVTPQTPPLFRPLEEHSQDQLYTSGVNLMSENINKTIESVTIKDVKAGY